MRQHVVGDHELGRPAAARARMSRAAARPKKRASVGTPAARARRGDVGRRLDAEAGDAHAATKLRSR